jgi:aryl-alcohol dehydrogenase-like predicted oxidoreductase
MGNGVLTGSLRTLEDFTKQGDLRAALPWLKEDNLEKNVAVVDKLSEIAKAKGVTTAQLALAWLLAQGDDIFPIPGTKGIHHLTDNLESMSISLSADEEKSVRKLSPEAIGGRLQAMTGYAFADTPPL